MQQYKIQRFVHSPCDVPKTSVYAQNIAYCQPEGTRLIESMFNETRGFTERLGLRFYQHKLYRRMSEDNGKTWSVQHPVETVVPETLEGFHYWTYQHFLDQSRNILISSMAGVDMLATQDKGEKYSDAGLLGGYRRMFYQFSHDGGLSWKPRKQLIHEGNQYDSVHWGPGLFYGKTGGFEDSSPWIRRSNGEILSALVVDLNDGKKYQIAVLHATWNEAGDDLIWQWSEYISVDATQSTQGACEPSMVELPDGRIIMGIRCSGDLKNETFPSLKFQSISTDGGWTWSKPTPLTYEDGQMVWSPSSYHTMIRSSASGKIYWIGNILDQPSFGSYPRHPLAIAEFDPVRHCLLRETVGMIQALPENAPERRRYTNFGLYEDRLTKEFVIYLPEQPKTSWEDFSSDCIGYRITLPG